MMPAVTEERRAPRIVGVEFPYGHAFGMPGDRKMQRRVLELALRVLAGAKEFGTRVDIDIEWPYLCATLTEPGSPRKRARSSGSFSRLFAPGTRRRRLDFLGTLYWGSSLIEAELMQ